MELENSGGKSTINVAVLWTFSRTALFLDTHMQRDNLLKNEDVIGKFIRRVCHVDLPAKDDFQERLIIVEMESGVRFNVLQDHQIFDRATNLGVVYKYFGDECALKPVFERGSNKDLESPVRTMIIPYEAKYRCGVILENGFALYEGFSMWDSGAIFHLPDSSTKESLMEFRLDDMGVT